MWRHDAWQHGSVSRDHFPNVITQLCRAPAVVELNRMECWTHLYSDGRWFSQGLERADQPFCRRNMKSIAEIFSILSLDYTGRVLTERDVSSRRTSVELVTTEVRSQPVQSCHLETGAQDICQGWATSTSTSTLVTIVISPFWSLVWALPGIWWREAVNEILPR